MTHVRRPRLAPGAVAVLLVVAAGCSSDDPAPSSSSGSPTTVVAAPSTAGAAGTAGALDPTDPGEQEPARDVPRVDLVTVAVAALEERLGAPQQYFEVNATSSLVNVILALNDGALAQTWLYLDGELSSDEPRPAEGDTFTAEQIRFDPEAVLAKVATDLPGSALDLFFITAPGGTVQYRVVVTSRAGGQLIVQLAENGDVIDVEADAR